ncbi:MAG: hypothetical protein KAR44_07800 [Candidatus Aegiribacteria sp.]|nr:hypothetical protein [Candidatus Aegiribacteria sp.]
MSYTKVILSLLAAVLLAASCSDPTGAIIPDDHSLGWGQALADAVRDSEFPDGVLFMVSCIDVNDEGDPETAIPWQFYYAEVSDSTSVLIVMVQYIGTTNHIWEDSTSVPLGSLPDYASAGPWVSAARDSLGSAYSDWEEYALVVKGNEYPEFPVVLNVAVLQFMSPDTTSQLSVILDSDNDNVLGMIEY